MIWWVNEIYYKIFIYRNKAQSETEEEEETAQEKRLRLAKKYLQEIEEEGTKFSLIFLCLIFYVFRKEEKIEWFYVIINLLIL